MTRFPCSSSSQSNSTGDRTKLSEFLHCFLTSVFMNSCNRYWSQVQVQLVEHHHRVDDNLLKTSVSKFAKIYWSDQAESATLTLWTLQLLRFPIQLCWNGLSRSKPNSIVCVYDQAIYAKAYIIQCKKTREVQKLIFVDGHLSHNHDPTRCHGCTFLKMLDSKDLVIQSVLVAEGSVEDTMCYGSSA